ncbi:MAG: HAMP domain-containing protein, partial [Nitrospirae bacterium]|nr:HAMP domain-containing protein [Nitrospirota bacterium]
MSNTNPNSFSRRVFITAAVFVIIFSSVCSAWFISIQRKSLVDKLILEGVLIVELLATNARIGIFTENEGLIIPYADAVLAHEDAVSVAVFNADGKLILNKTKDLGINKYTISASDPKVLEQNIARMKTNPVASHAEYGNAVEFWSPVTAYTGYATEIAHTQNTKPGRLVGFVTVVLSRKLLLHEMELTVYKSILTTIFFLLLGLSITYAFIRHISLPVRKLMYSVRNLGDSSFPKKIPVLSNDEFGQLAESFNDMIDELQRRQEEKERLESQILHNHKMDVIGCLAADISNDFSSLVNVFTSKIFVAKNYLTPGHKAYEELDNLSGSIEHAKDIARKLSEFSKNTPVFMEVQSLANFLKQATPLLMMPSPLKLNLLIDDKLYKCRFDKWQLNRVVGGILDNAKEASPTGGAIIIEATNIEISNNINVADGQYA